MKRHCSGSHATAYLYIRGVHEYCKWCKTDPDKMVADCLTEEDLPTPNRTVIIAGNERSEGQMETLLAALRQKLKEELLEKPIVASKTV